MLPTSTRVPRYRLFFIVQIAGIVISFISPFTPEPHQATDNQVDHSHVSYHCGSVRRWLSPNYDSRISAGSAIVQEGLGVARGREVQPSHEGSKIGKLLTKPLDRFGKDAMIHLLIFLRSTLFPWSVQLGWPLAHGFPSERRPHPSR